MPANLTYVDDVEFSNNSGSTTIALPAQNVAAGNLLVLGLRWEGGGVSDATTASISDTAGNSWQLIGYQSTGGGSETERIALFYCLSAIAEASNVVTATLSASRSFRQAICAQYSYDGTIELGDTGSGLSTTNTTSVTSSPALDAAAEDLVVGWMGQFSSANIFAPAAGYTARDSLGLAAFIEQVAASPDTFSPGGTFSSGSDTYVLLTAVFQAVEVGGEISGSTTLTFAQSAQLGGYLNASGSAALTFNQAAQLGGYLNASGSAALAFNQAANLSSYLNAVGAATLTFDANGTATILLNAVGSASLTFATSAEIRAYANLAGSTTFEFDVSSTLNNDLRGSAALTFATQANLTALASVSGSTSLTFAASGSLSSGSGLSGSATLSFSASGRLAGVLNAQGSTSLTFSHAAQLGAYVNAASEVSLSFSVNGALVAYANMSGESSLVFTLNGRLASPFPPGVALFGVPIEQSVFKVIPYQHEFKINRST
jgi:hypothetical protein